MAAPKNKPQYDVPVITLKALIIMHVVLFVLLALWAWLDWSLPQ
ncbi:hypothetical protein [Acetobacter indonesiensis]|nr:hypothetical protein [Acetobacter indonesiensis]